MSLSGAGKVAGVIGWPIAHSLSPQLHGYWLEELKLDGVLVPLAVRPEDFAAAIAGLKSAGLRGVNVTVPHKEAAFALADIRDEAAQAAGAANVLIFREDGRVEAHNTDAVGLRDSLRAEMVAGKEVLMLGAGGAARGAVLALNELGAAKIHILNRSADKAASLAKALQPLVKSHLNAGGFDVWAKFAGTADLVLNTTSAGMRGNPALDLDLGALSKKPAVVDIVYNPLETPLLKQARALGFPVMDGLGMLMHQAVPSFEAFFGVRPRVTPGLRKALEQALGAHKPYVVGLTGGIGMGKSETAKLFAAEGIPIHDSDSATALLYAKGGAAVEPIARAFPGAVKNGEVDRAALSAHVVSDPGKLTQLEALVHPLVAADRLQYRNTTKAPIVIFDVPLLYESGAQAEMDAVVVATAPESVQRERVLARPGMTAEKFEALKARQMSDVEKRAQAHYVVTTHKGLDHARGQVKMILADIRAKLDQNA